MLSALDASSEISSMSLPAACPVRSFSESRPWGSSSPTFFQQPTLKEVDRMLAFFMVACQNPHAMIVGKSLASNSEQALRDPPKLRAAR